MASILDKKLWVAPTLRRLQSTKELRDLFEKEIVEKVETSTFKLR